MEGIVIKRNRFKDVLRRKKQFICTCRVLFYLYLAWYFVSAGFSLPNKMSIAWCFQTSNVIIIINAIFVSNNAKILFCSIRVYFDGMFSCFPETENALIANSRRVQGQKPGSCIPVHGNGRLKQEINFLHGFSFAL